MGSEWSLYTFRLDRTGPELWCLNALGGPHKSVPSKNDAVLSPTTSHHLHNCLFSLQVD